MFPPKWQRCGPWAALFLFFLVYRFAWINGTGLGIEEGNSFRVSHSFSSALSDGSGAAYFVLLFFWKSLFSGSEFALRSLSVAIDAASFVLFLFICRQLSLSQRQLIVAAILYIVFPPNVVNAQGVRPYVLWSLLQMALWCTVWSATASPTQAMTQARAVGLWLLCQVLFFLSLHTHPYTGVYALGWVLAAGTKTKWNKRLVLWFWPWLVFAIFSSRSFTEQLVSYREWGPLFPVGALIVDPRWNYLLKHPLYHGAVGAAAFALCALGVRHHYQKGHTQESIWLVCLLLPVSILTLLPWPSYPALLQPTVPVFCIGLAIAFASWMEARSVAIRRGALVLGWIVAGVFLKTGYQIKREVLRDFRAAVGNLVDTQPPETLMLTVPHYADAVAKYYAGENKMLRGFSGTADDALSLAATLPAFEFVELIVLTGQWDDVWRVTLDTIGQTHVPTEHWEFAGVEVDRFKRKPSVSIVPKSEASQD